MAGKTVSIGKIEPVPTGGCPAGQRRGPVRGRRARRATNAPAGARIPGRRPDGPCAIAAKPPDGVPADRPFPRPRSAKAEPTRHLRAARAERAVGSAPSPSCSLEQVYAGIARRTRERIGANSFSKCCNLWDCAALCTSVVSSQWSVATDTGQDNGLQNRSTLSRNVPSGLPVHSLAVGDLAGKKETVATKRVFRSAKNIPRPCVFVQADPV